MTTRGILFVTALSVGLVLMGVVCGVIADQIRFDHQRAAVLDRYERALSERNRERMNIELRARGRHPAFTAEWTRSIARIDDALQRGDTAAALAAWRASYTDAVRRGWWEQLADAGDAALRIGDVPDLAGPSRAAARKSYLAALFRARADGSVDGVLRIAQAFAGLGDRAVVEQCIRIGRELADADGHDRDRVQAFAQRYASASAKREGP
jgi:hypothetical protein